MPRAPLTDDELNTIFLGRNAPKKAPRATSRAPKDTWPLYDKCDGCKTTKPLLVTFHGETDWAPAVPEIGSVRSLVSALRTITGSRTILLCHHCIGIATVLQPTASTTGQRLPGNWG